MGNMIKTIFTLAITLLCLCTMAQETPITNNAVQLCQNHLLEEAKSKIAEALMSEQEQNLAYTWYVAGFIYKECYKEFDSGKRDSQYRTQAADYLVHALEIDKKREHTANIKIALKFLASTYYNDALMCTREFDETSETEPEKYFNLFRKLMRSAEPGCNLDLQDKDYHQQMAQRYFDLWQKNVDKNELSEKALKHYQTVLMLDSSDCMVHYNIGVLHYNRAVFLYRSIGLETEMFDLVDIQTRASDLIKNKALPAMRKADSLCREHAEVLRGLLFMNKALEREKDVEYFKEEIERLIEEGKMRNLVPKKK